MEATITMDDNGGGFGWFFDETPLDDIEFTSIADTFQASFIDATTVGQANQNDFYRTITHEIGHAMGVLLDGTLESPAARLYDIQIQNGQPTAVPIPETFFPIPDNDIDARLGQLVYVGIDQVDPFRIVSNPDGSLLANGNFTGDELAREQEIWQYTLANGNTFTFTESGGGHIYEGMADPNVPGADRNLNELMNAGRVVPAGNNPAETTRQFISDLTAEFLADAYGYAVTLPSDLPDFSRVDPVTQEVTDVFTSGTAQILYDTYNETLLIQGLANDPGNTALRVNDTINVTQVGNDLRIAINYTLNDGEQREVIRNIEASRVGQILIAGNGGNDNITFDPALANLVQLIDYVVSSNEDVLEDAGQSTTDGIVDVSDIIPGNQTTLRAAIIEANAGTGEQSIYVGRGTYNLTRAGGGTTQGDLDINGNLTLIGAGAGLTVINASAVNDRLFEVSLGDRLDLSRMTLTGGNATSGGAILAVNGELLVSEAAFIDNTATFGGAIRAGNNSTVTIERSVFTDNQASSQGGAVFVGNTGVTTTIGSSVFADNSATTGGANVWLGTTNTFTSQGNNLVDNNQNNLFNQANDYVGSVDHVVTSIADTFNATPDVARLSLREAINLANISTSSSTEIWLPAWTFRLTRAGQGGVGVGTIDISTSISLRGISQALTTVDARHIMDEAFVLIGDANHDGAVTGGDFSAVANNFGNVSTNGAPLMGDANDDGAVTGGDFSAISNNFGNVFNDNNSLTVLDAAFS